MSLSHLLPLPPRKAGLLPPQKRRTGIPRGSAGGDGLVLLVGLGRRGRTLHGGRTAGCRGSGLGLWGRELYLSGNTSHEVPGLLADGGELKLESLRVCVGRLYGAGAVSGQPRGPPSGR